MMNFYWRSYDTCHITIPKTDIIYKFHFLNYNSQSLNLINDKNFVGNGRLFYVKGDGKLDLF